MQTRSATKRIAEVNTPPCNEDIVYIAVYKLENKRGELWKVKLGDTDMPPYIMLRVDFDEKVAEGHIDAPCDALLITGHFFNTAFGPDFSHYDFAYYVRRSGRSSKLQERDPHFGMQRGDMVEDTHIATSGEALVARLRRHLGIQGELPECVHIACVEEKVGRKNEDDRSECFIFCQLHLVVFNAEQLQSIQKPCPG
jgi:hypothetical protein